MKVILTEGLPLYSDGALLQGRHHDGGRYGKIELENGVWIEDMGDGRYYDGDKLYAEVNEYDDTFDRDDPGNYQGIIKFLGFIKL